MRICANHVHEYETSMQSVNIVIRLCNDTVYMELRICFCIAKNENYIFSLCETPNEIIHAFCLFQFQFHHSMPLKLIKINAEVLSLLLGLSPA